MIVIELEAACVNVHNYADSRGIGICKTSAVGEHCAHGGASDAPSRPLMPLLVNHGSKMVEVQAPQRVERKRCILGVPR